MAAKRKCCQCSKQFVPKFDTKTVRQKVCSNKCCIEYYDRQTHKSRKLATEVAKMVGKRSMGEVRFEYENLEGKGIKRYITKSEYESDCFDYLVEETKHYTPDWKLTLPSGKVIYIEYKGVLDKVTRKKMKLVREQHPDLDIRFVFQKGQNKIYKGSKTTYMKWAEQHGFEAADGGIPLKWLK